MYYFLFFLCPFLLISFIFTVVDDENPTEVTANAIVTVTVSLYRQNMSEIFGDESVKELKNIDENSVEPDAKEGGGGDGEPESQAVKRPAWLKQKKGGGKKKDKGKKAPKVRNSIKTKAEESPVSPPKNKLREKEEKINDEDTEESDSDDDGKEVNERSSEEEVKESNVEDDDQV